MQRLYFMNSSNQQQQEAIDLHDKFRGKFCIPLLHLLPTFSALLCMCCMCRGRCEQSGGRMEIIASANPPLAYCLLGVSDVIRVETLLSLISQRHMATSLSKNYLFIMGKYSLNINLVFCCLVEWLDTTLRSQLIPSLPFQISVGILADLRYLYPGMASKYYSSLVLEKRDMCSSII